MAFAVTARAGASGTYQLGFLYSPGLGGGAWELAPQEPLRCGYYGQLVAGSGQPDYVQPTGCISYEMMPSSSSSSSSSTVCLCPTSPAACPCASETTEGSNGGITLPGIPYPLLSGSVYFFVVGVASSDR